MGRRSAAREFAPPEDISDKTFTLFPYYTYVEKKYRLSGSFRSIVGVMTD